MKAVGARRFRVREVRFKNVHQMLMTQLPGASATTIRELATARVRAIVHAFCAAFERQNVHAQRISVEINQGYLRAVEEAARDPLAAGNPGGHTLREEEAQLLTNVAQGVAFCFVCRNPDCLYFGFNSHATQNILRTTPQCRTASSGRTFGTSPRS